MKPISLPGPECAREIMRVLVSRKAEGSKRQWIPQRHTTEVAWAASRTKGSAYSAIYNGIAKRRGKKRALIALGHRILCDIYKVLTTGEAYVDEGAEAVFKRNSKAREGAMIRTLERSGYTITKATA
jgi:hypothetical protein